MNPKLLSVLTYLDKSTKQPAGMTAGTLKAAADDLIQALNRAFNKSPRQHDKTPGMSALGRPLCQLQLEKAGVEGIPLTPTEKMNFLVGDVVEVVLKAILRSVDELEFKDGEKSVLSLPSGDVFGASDCSTNGEVDDIKSASPWAFDNKFRDFTALSDGDSFGYIPQLVAYGESEGKKLGGWWAVNKANGEITYLPMDETKVNPKEVLDKLEANLKALKEDKPFEKCFTDEPETFRRKPTGNRILPKGSACYLCKFRYHCWPTLQEKASEVSEAKNPPMIMYTFIQEKTDG